MSYFCVHEMFYSGTYYDPPEFWCGSGYDDKYECGEDCPYRYSQEDFDGDRANYEYEALRDSIDF